MELVKVKYYGKKHNNYEAFVIEYKNYYIYYGFPYNDYDSSFSYPTDNLEIIQSRFNLLEINKELESQLNDKISDVQERFYRDKNKIDEIIAFMDQEKIKYFTGE